MTGRESEATFRSGPTPNNAPPVQVELQWSCNYVNDIKAIHDEISTLINMKDGGGKYSVPRDSVAQFEEMLVRVLMIAVDQEKRISYLEGMLRKQEEIVENKKAEEDHIIRTIQETQKTYKEALASGPEKTTNEKQEFTVIIRVE